MNAILLARFSISGRFLRRMALSYGKWSKLPRFLHERRPECPKARVKGVVFDMGGVILPSPLPVIHKVEQDHGLPAGVIRDMIIKNYNSHDGNNAN